MQSKCRKCGDEFKRENNSQRNCDRCRYRRCCCGKQFIIRPNAKKTGRYCSRMCSNKNQRMSPGVIAMGRAHRKNNLRGKMYACGSCGKEVYRYPKVTRNNKTGQYFCSRTCFNFGFVFSEELRAKIANSLIGRYVGPLSPNWRGGISKGHREGYVSHRYSAWVLAVFRKDRFTCVFCGAYGSKIVADHIFPWCLFPELRYDITNGRTLCDSCHKRTPTYGSKVKKLRREDFLLMPQS